VVVLVLEAPTPGITGHKHSADMLNTLLERPADGYRLSFHQPFNERGKPGGSESLTANYMVWKSTEICGLLGG